MSLRQPSLDHTDSLQYRIELQDNTLGSDEPQTGLDDRHDDNASTVSRQRTNLSQRVNRNALRQEITKRKYTRYQEARYLETTRPPLSNQRTSSRSVSATQDALEGSPQDLGPDEGNMGHSTPAREGRWRRGHQRVRGLLHRKKLHGRLEGDVEIDVLYENQRGGVFFGLPLFSSNSLLNFDPSAWLNAQGKPSTVNITNAQVPDPSWEWAWTTWYVDMSNDVDEQGWQYSFMFQNRFAWHGTHPWFHSFVRRRRWIRKRARIHRPGHDGRPGTATNLKDAHKLNSDYFTIHPASNRPVSDALGTASFVASSAGFRGQHSLTDEDRLEIESLGKLRECLRDAMVDREKTQSVLQFMDQGGQDTFYLADEMPRIMSTLLYQYSKRHLLSAMVDKVDRVSEDWQSRGQQSQADSAEQSRRVESLLRAVKAADLEIQRLEFWSDIRDAIYRGQSSGAMSGRLGWGQGWDGAERYGRGLLATGKTTVDERPVAGAAES